jgi:hypothetical protein
LPLPNINLKNNNPNIKIVHLQKSIEKGDSFPIIYIVKALQNPFGEPCAKGKSGPKYDTKKDSSVIINFNQIISNF